LPDEVIKMLVNECKYRESPLIEHNEDMKAEPTITGYQYDVVAQKTMLLIGEDLDTAEDVEGWNINLIKNELWSDGDVVQCNVVTITATTNESEVEYLKSVVKTSAVFTLSFELVITQGKAYKMFK
jgi:hypothetical protein